MQLVTCVAGNCDETRADLRESATFNVANLRALYGDWFAAPAPLTCNQNARGPNFVGDPHKTAMRVGALQLGAAGETQVVTVQNPEKKKGETQTGSARWLRLIDGTPLPTTCDGSESSIPLDKDAPAWIAVAPAATDDPTQWIALAIGNAVAGSEGEGPLGAAGRAYLITAGQPAVDMPLQPRDSYQAISALPVDLDNDGDTDFVVLARESGVEGRELQDSDRRVRFYMNVACQGRPEERCLFVKPIDVFEGVSGDALAWAQSPLEAAHFATSREKGVLREWWLGAVTGGTQSGTGRVKTGRFRVDGLDREVNVAAVAGSASEAPVPAAQVKYQHVAWGDFDGDTALDLLYVSNRGSRIFRRAEKTK